MDRMGDKTYVGNIVKNLLKLKNKFKKLGKSLVVYMKKSSYQDAKGGIKVSWEKSYLQNCWFTSQPQQLDNMSSKYQEKNGCQNSILWVGQSSKMGDIH